MIALRPFQKRFIAGVLAPTTQRAVLSGPRGLGKSWICGWLIAESLRPDGQLFNPGDENVLLSGSFDQARYCFRFAKAMLGTEGYSFQDNKQALGIHHKETGTRLVVKSSRAKGAFGIVGARIAIADEPGAWDLAAGEMMADALDTALGKPGSNLTVVYVGTLAPLGSPGHWWHELVTRGSHRSTYVQALQGDPKRWDNWQEIRRCNPLVSVSKELRLKLLEERDAARSDPRLKARFLSYRLNIPTGDESTMLLTVDDWLRVQARPVQAREGRPIVGVDLGAGRAWSAAVAVWRSGRVEALAVAPGVPDLSAQEKRDRVAVGTYQKLADSGALLLADGLQVQTVKQVLDAIRSAWGRPDFIVCDRFRLLELEDTRPGCPIVPRVSRWSESSMDIRTLRRCAKDGPLSCDPAARGLLTASLAVAMVKPDDAGSVRMVKRGTNNQARDDVAAALVLAVGQAESLFDRPKRTAPRFFVA